MKVSTSLSNKEPDMKTGHTAVGRESSSVGDVQ